jgi:hypothetical protein
MNSQWIKQKDQLPSFLQVHQEVSVVDVIFFSEQPSDSFFAKNLFIDPSNNKK